MRISKILYIALVIFIAEVFGSDASFQEVPPIIGAYTLPGGQWQIGLGIGLPLQSPEYWASSGSVAYGITDRLQVAVGIGYGRLSGPSPFYSSYSLSGKLRWPFSQNFDFALPVSISFLDTSAGVSFSGIHSGIAFSMKTGLGFTLHGGWSLGYSKTGFYWGSPHGMVDLDISPLSKIIAEFSFRPLSISVNLWLRTLDFLDIAFTFSPLSLWLGLAVYIRI